MYQLLINVCKLQRAIFFLNHVLLLYLCMYHINMYSLCVCIVCIPYEYGRYVSEK